MNQKGFEGWYFRHQKGGDTVALIPGRAESGAFIQMITPTASRQFAVPELRLEDGVIYAGSCLFSRHGCKIDLPGVWGEITYGAFTVLSSDIMGPFRFFPMECRHGIISMAHTLEGSLTVDYVEHCFQGGRGYLEKDSGISFPSSYLWLQCSDFQEPCSAVAAIATIPFFGRSFQGCICAIVCGGREYRLATYRGVRIRQADAERICLTQGKLRLEIDMRPSCSGHPLRAPVRGRMQGIIRESNDAYIHMRLWEGGGLVLDLTSDHAAYEFVPPAT